MDIELNSSSGEEEKEVGFVHPYNRGNLNRISALNTMVEYVVLVIDEMKFFPNFLFEKGTNNLIGFVDLDDPDVNLACHNGRLLKRWLRLRWFFACFPTKTQPRSKCCLCFGKQSEY